LSGYQAEQESKPAALRLGEKRADGIIPFAPVRRVHADLIIGPGPQPTPEAAAAREHKGMRLAGVENGKLQIAVEGCCCDGLPRHKKKVKHANSQRPLIRINVAPAQWVERGYQGGGMTHWRNRVVGELLKH
jgi:hypothetical protein